MSDSAWNKEPVRGERGDWGGVGCGEPGDRAVPWQYKLRGICCDGKWGLLAAANPAEIHSDDELAGDCNRWK